MFETEMFFFFFVERTNSAPRLHITQLHMPLAVPGKTKIETDIDGWIQ